MMNKNKFEYIFKKWDKYIETEKWKDFYKFLKKDGWKWYNSKGCWKAVFIKEKYVLKFDSERSENSHTKGEYLSWIRSSEKRRKYMVKPLIFYKGLLIQPLLSGVYKGRMENVPDEVFDIARKFRFSHYWNYGYLNGKLKFYDTDSLGVFVEDIREREYENNYRRK